MISKGRANVYLKVTIEKKWSTQNFDFLGLKSTSPGQFWGPPSHADIFIEFSNFLLQFKDHRCGSKTCMQILYYFNFEMNCDVLTSESPFFLLNKNINFDKNETESKMENLTEPCASAHEESRMKSKTVMNWSSRKKKIYIFCNVYFVRRKIF